MNIFWTIILVCWIIGFLTLFIPDYEQPKIAVAMAYLLVILGIINELT